MQAGTGGVMATAAEVKKIKTLLGLDTGTSCKEDALVEFAADAARETILNYCHLDKMPEGLAGTAARMAADIYRNEQYGKQKEASHVSSIKVGDTSTSFGSAADGYGSSILKDYEAALKRYRKLVFK